MDVEPRNKSLQCLENSLSKYLTKIQISDLEKGIYNWTLQFSDENEINKNWNNKRFVNIYCDKVRSIIQNLDPTSVLGNKRLIERFNENEFKIFEIPFMKPENVCPEVWRGVLDAKLHKEQFLAQNKPAAMTNAFKCGKCKKRETLFKEVQTKSCDEPMTLFITCLNCGHRWKM